MKSQPMFQRAAFLCLFALSLGCMPAATAQIFLGQGVIAGEVTTNSVLLHTRLTASESLQDGDVPGIRGVVRFEVDTDLSFKKPLQTEWLNARTEAGHGVSLPRPLRCT
jgi:alkaline phosphatase D